MQEDENNNTSSNSDRLLESVTKALNASIETNAQVLKMARADERLRKFKIVMIIIPICLVLAFYFYQMHQKSNPFEGDTYVSLVEINGEISANSSSQATARKINASLRKAFKDEKSQGIFISIDSPGGSPAESSRIHDEILTLKAQYPDKKVIAFGNSSLTSGAYWIATAADEIHSMPLTIVGSIGAVMTTYDFSRLAQKYEVNKLVIVAGENKHRLDNMKVPTEKDIAKYERLLAVLHEQFKDTVRASRQDKINELKHPDLFSGDFWIGVEALELGLVDSVTSQNALLQDKFGTVKRVDYTNHPTVLDTLNSQRVFSEINALFDTKIR